MHILLWAKLWVARTCGKLYYRKAIKAPIMYCNEVMQWCTTEHAKYLKAKDTEFIVLLTWQQLKCQHEVISFLIVFPKNIRRLIYVYYIVIEGYRQLCCHNGTVHLALFSTYLKKTGKYIELCFLLIMKSIITSAVGSKFYQYGLKVQ